VYRYVKKHDLPQTKITEPPSSKIKKVIDNDDEIYLGSDKFIALSKKNPKLLGEIMQNKNDIAMKKLYQKKKAAGLSVTYRDNEYPGCLIREDADDRRFIIDLDPNNGYKEIVIREIPPRHKTA
jgi:hypothetical protein